MTKKYRSHRKTMRKKDMRKKTMSKKDMRKKDMRKKDMRKKTMRKKDVRKDVRKNVRRKKDMRKNVRRKKYSRKVMMEGGGEGWGEHRVRGEDDILHDIDILRGILNQDDHPDLNNIHSLIDVRLNELEGHGINISERYPDPLKESRDELEGERQEIASDKLKLYLSHLQSKREKDRSD